VTGQGDRGGIGGEIKKGQVSQNAGGGGRGGGGGLLGVGFLGGGGGESPVRAGWVCFGVCVGGGGVFGCFVGDGGGCLGWGVGVWAGGWGGGGGVWVPPCAPSFRDPKSLSKTFSPLSPSGTDR